MAARAYDAIIIGAGISGASAAWFLARAGLKKVLILEKEARPAYHASGRSAASIVELDFIPELMRLKVESAKFFRAPPPGFVGEDSALFDRTGVLLLFDAPHMELLRAFAPTMEALGVKIELWSVEQVLEKYPLRATAALAGGALLPDDGRIDVDRLLKAYLGNTELSLSTAVRKIESLAGRVIAVHTDTERIETRWVINAAGAWASEVGRLAGASLMPLVPYRRTIAVFDPPPGIDPAGWPLIAHDAQHWYVAPAAEGRMLASPMDQDASAPCDARPDAKTLETLRARLDEVAPALTPRASWVKSWAGLRTFAEDRLPIIGEDPKLGGFFWLAGQGGCGIEASAAFGRIASELIMYGRAKDAEPFSPARFSAAR